MAKYNITNESQLIDITTITNGCAKIETAAQKFAEAAQHIYSGSDICSDKALSVDKTTMQPQLDADAEYVKSMQAAINDFTLQIKNVALQIYAEQQAELADYRYQQQLEQQQAAANNGNATP